jgi:hypothetical protein
MSNQPEIREIETSSIVMEIPEAYSGLADNFKVAIYRVPATYYRQYNEVHMILHQQLTQPYRYWTNDPEGNAVYVLYEKSQPCKPLTFDNIPVEPEIKTFNQIVFHMIVKLLLEDFFRGGNDTFTGQGKHYSFARWKNKSETKAICLQFDISAAKGIGKTDSIQIFDLYAGARTFIIEAEKYFNPSKRDYYARTFSHGDSFSLQMLTQQEAKDRFTKGEPLWVMPTYGGNTRTRLAFFTENDIEKSRGYLLQRFCHQFAQRLNEFGIPARPRQRTFTRYYASRPKHASALDLTLDNARFYILDIRHNQTVPLDYYVERFSDWFVDSTFIPLDNMEQAESVKDGAVIALMDADKEAYEDTLADLGLEDPYYTLYETYPHIPLQGFNVNPNPVDHTNYLNYAEWTQESAGKLIKDQDFEQRAQLTVRDAFLKHLILNEVSYTDLLPSTPALHQHLFVYRGLHKQRRYTAFLTASEGNIEITGLTDPKSWQKLQQICNIFGVDWDEIEDALDQKRRGKGDYDFFVVIGSGVASEIVDCSEYGFHDFGEIKRRADERKQLYDIDYFRAIPHYDDYAKEKNNWPLITEIQEMDLENQSPRFLSNTQLAAVDLLNKLKQHDEYLEQFAKHTPRISRNQLLGTRNKPTNYRQMLDKIGLSPTILTNVHNAGEKFLNPRNDNIMFYQGIWADYENNIYMVGSPDSIKPTVKNAHTLREFEPLIGEGVNLDDMLQLMAVGFVRLGQYTVLPYPFKLIRLYIENCLYWEQLQSL